MGRKQRPLTEAEQQELARDRLRYFIAKCRRDPKSLTNAENDELCRLVAELSPNVSPADPGD